MIYAIMIIFSVISGCLVPYAEKKKKKSKSTIYMKNIKRNGMISISLLFPLLVSSLRYGLGTDYSYTYIPQFYISFCIFCNFFNRFLFIK